MAEGRLEGRVAVVTGGGRGIGQAIAKRLSSEGAAVAVLDINAAQDAAQEIAGAGGTARGWTCDVADKATVDGVVGEVAATLGGIDVLVNNAGLLSGRRSFLEIDKEEMLRYYTVNTVGYLHMAQSCFPFLRDSRHAGRIVNVSSRTFFTGSPGQLAYVASKGGVFGLTRVLRARTRGVQDHRQRGDAVPGRDTGDRGAFGTGDVRRDDVRTGHQGVRAAGGLRGDRRVPRV